jgi:hypothetical protein
MSIRLTHLALTVSIVAVTSSPVMGQSAPQKFAAEAVNLTLLSHTTLNGRGDGGESMEIQQWPDGRKVLFFVHQSDEHCLSVVDVTNPEKPEVLVYLPSPSPGDTQCNSLGLSGNVLAVANWTTNATQKGHKGFWLLDVSSPERILKARSLQDLAFSFYDASVGPHTRGSHWLWFVDGEFVHLAMTASDKEPTANGHDLMYIIVDVRDRKAPREVAKWWVPGTMKGDACLPGCMPKGPEASRAHNIQVYADRPDRAYVGYFGAGWYILDISGLADIKAGRAKTFTPKVVTQFRTEPVNGHNLQPIPGTKYAWAGDEVPAQREGTNKCANTPKMLWLMDMSDETEPHMAGWAPFAENAAELCQRPGRYGPYNLHTNTPTPTTRTLKNTMVATYFGGGLRIFRLVPLPALGHVPPRIVEIGHFIPEPPAGAPASELGGLLVASDGLIYVNDRRVGGLYILRYTGTEPLD